MNLSKENNKKNMFYTIERNWANNLKEIEDNCLLIEQVYFFPFPFEQDYF